MIVATVVVVVVVGQRSLPEIVKDQHGESTEERTAKSEWERVITNLMKSKSQVNTQQFANSKHFKELERVNFR